MTTVPALGEDTMVIATGYVKNQSRRDGQLRVIAAWKADVDLLGQVASATEGFDGNPLRV